MYTYRQVASIFTVKNATTYFSPDIANQTPPKRATKPTYLGSRRTLVRRRPRQPRTLLIKPPPNQQVPIPQPLPQALRPKLLRPNLILPLDIATDPTPAAGLVNNPRAPNNHPLVQRLAHVEDGERRALHGHQRLHLHARRAHALDQPLDRHEAAARRGGPDGADVVGGDEVDVYFGFGDCQRVAEGDDVRGAFGGHDACDARDAEDVAFFVAVFFDLLVDFWADADVGHGDGGALCGGFGADVDHVGFAGWADVG